MSIINSDISYISHWQNEFLMEINHLEDAISERDAYDGLPCSSTVSQFALNELDRLRADYNQVADACAGSIEGSLNWLCRELCVAQDTQAYLTRASLAFAEQAIQTNRLENLARLLAHGKTPSGVTAFDRATEVLSNYPTNHMSRQISESAMNSLKELAETLSHIPPLTWSYTPLSVTIRFWDKTQCERYLTEHQLFSVFAWATNNTEQEMRHAILARPAEAIGVEIFRRLS